MTDVRKLVLSLLVGAATALQGCAAAPGVAGSTSDAKLVQGPPISDIVTPFDKALTCLKGKISPRLIFSVGAVLDQTGKESFTDGGVGKFITQGAGDMMQSALFKAGATVVNRRDPRVATTEAEWKVRDITRQIPSNFFITGSINSLDFIPGSGAEVEVGGVGARYRQNRILVGMDLAMTEATTGRIVANVPLQKQIFSSEAGIGIGRFIGSELTSVDFGGREREAIHFALRQMLNLATFELLTQVMKPENYADCRTYIDRAHGRIDNTKTAEAIEAYNERPKGPPPGVDVTVPSSVPAAGTARAAPVAPASEAEPVPAATVEPPGNQRQSQDTSQPYSGSDGGTTGITKDAKAQAILAQ
ncbi:CsgG/HfaB family protein [Aureimonas flava]|uniref:CsgG/HfaB family protein n=1 Tax=Aureimonas flava TaxID=2320271 RepID=UPI001459FFFE|nr:CsgG/HfaB family protein [Aureimonas flava]